MRIAIFGTVGAGKTTLIKNLGEMLPEDYQIYWEPLEVNPYFKELYTNPEQKRNRTYKMEIWMLAARMRQLEDSKKFKNVIFDRGVVDTLIFSDANHKLGNIDDRDYTVYEEYFETSVIPSIFHKGDSSYDLQIYLKVDDETSISRINKRGIPEELLVGNDFWRLLNQTYEKWYQKLKDITPFYVVDGNYLDSESLAKEIVKHLETIQK